MSISSNFGFVSSGRIMLSGQETISRRLNLTDDPALAVIIDFNRPMQPSYPSYNSNGEFKESASSAAIRQALERHHENEALYGEDFAKEMLESLKESSVKIVDFASKAKQFLNLSEKNKYSINIADVNSLSADLETLEGELEGLLESTTNPLEIKAIKQQLNIIKALSTVLQTVIKNLVKIDDALDIDGLQELLKRFDKIKEDLTEGLSASISSGQAAIIPKTIEAMGEQLKSVFKLAHVIEDKIEKLKEIEALKEKEDKQIEKMLDKLGQEGIWA